MKVFECFVCERCSNVLILILAFILSSFLLRLTSTIHRCSLCNRRTRHSLTVLTMMLIVLISVEHMQL